MSEDNEKIKSSKDFYTVLCNMERIINEPLDVTWMRAVREDYVKERDKNSSVGGTQNGR